METCLQIFHPRILHSAKLSITNGKQIFSGIRCLKNNRHPLYLCQKAPWGCALQNRDAQILTMGNPQPGWASTLLSTAKELPVTVDQFHSFLTDFNAQFMTLILPRQKKTCAIGNKRSNTAKKLWGSSGWWQRESSGWQLCPTWATNPA